MSVFRRHLNRLAWCALYAFLSGLAVPLYESHPIDAADDAACAIEGGVRLAGSTPLMGAAVPGDHASEHCVVCHWLRAMGGVVVQQVAALSTPATPTSENVFTSSPVLAADFLSGASRAPPLSALL